jgi:hypothetical protein
MLGPSFPRTPSDENTSGIRSMTSQRLNGVCPVSDSKTKKSPYPPKGTTPKIKRGHSHFEQGPVRRERFPGWRVRSLCRAVSPGATPRLNGLSLIPVLGPFFFSHPADTKQAALKWNLMVSANCKAKIRRVPGRPRHTLQVRRPQLPPSWGRFFACNSGMGGWRGKPGKVAT